MKQILVPGFSENVSPNVRPALCVFAKPNAGTTRLGTTMPHENGAIAFLALDQNCKTTLDEIKQKTGLPIIVNEEMFITESESIDIVMQMNLGFGSGTNAEAIKNAKLTNENQAKDRYLKVVDKIRKAAINLAKSDQVESVVIDKNSQLYNWILFSRHGRAQQIEQLARTVPNQDLVEIISMIRQKKNLLIIHRASEVYRKTGEKDNYGREKSESTGKYKPEAMGNIEGFVSATVELVSDPKWNLPIGNRRQSGESDEEYEKRAFKLKYSVRVHACKGRSLFEGSTLDDLPDDVESELSMDSGGYEGPGVSGRDITWENIMMALGISN